MFVAKPLPFSRKNHLICNVLFFHSVFHFYLNVNRMNVRRFGNKLFIYLYHLYIMLLVGEKINKFITRFHAPKRVFFLFVCFLIFFCFLFLFLLLFFVCLFCFVLFFLFMYLSFSRELTKSQSQKKIIIINRNHNRNHLKYSN